MNKIMNAKRVQLDKARVQKLNALLEKAKKEGEFGIQLMSLDIDELNSLLDIVVEDAPKAVDYGNLLAEVKEKVKDAQVSEFQFIGAPQKVSAKELTPRLKEIISEAALNRSFNEGLTFLGAEELSMIYQFLRDIDPTKMAELYAELKVESDSRLSPKQKVREIIENAMEEGSFEGSLPKFAPEVLYALPLDLERLITHAKALNVVASSEPEAFDSGMVSRYEKLSAEAKAEIEKRQGPRA